MVAVMAAVGASSANATPTIGIHQSYIDVAGRDVFASPNWPQLGVGVVRVVVPWDIATRSTDPNNRIAQFQAWLRAAGAAGEQPFVVFGQSELSVNAYGNYQAPYSGTFRGAVDRFLQLYGPRSTAQAQYGTYVRIIGAWNEPNFDSASVPGGPSNANTELPGNTGDYLSHDPGVGRADFLGDCSSGATTSTCGPLLAAYYWKDVYDAFQAINCASLNPTCALVAGEFDSTPNDRNQSSGTPGYWDAYAHYIASFGTVRPAIWGFHGHHDASVWERGEGKVGTAGDAYHCLDGNYGCTTWSFVNWQRGLGSAWSAQIWDSEIGALHVGMNGASADMTQADAVQGMLDLAAHNGVARLYYFNFQARSGDGSDPGLVDPASSNPADPNNTRPRWSWNVMRCRYARVPC